MIKLDQIMRHQGDDKFTELLNRVWELLDLSRNVLKIVTFNCINYVCIGGILHLL